MIILILIHSQKSSIQTTFWPTSHASDESAGHESHALLSSSSAPPSTRSLRMPPQRRTAFPAELYIVCTCQSQTKHSITNTMYQHTILYHYEPMIIYMYPGRGREEVQVTGRLQCNAFTYRPRGQFRPGPADFFTLMNWPLTTCNELLCSKWQCSNGRLHLLSQTIS